VTAVTAQLLRAEFERAVDHLSAGKFDSCFAARPGAKKSALAGHGIGVMARALAGNGTASAPPQPKLKSALKQKAYQKKCAFCKCVAHGKVDPTDGAFYCNPCWEEYEVEATLTQEAQLAVVKEAALEKEETAFALEQSVEAAEAEAETTPSWQQALVEPQGAKRKYRCPDCGLEFKKWSPCLEHVNETGHADAHKDRGPKPRGSRNKVLMQRCSTSVTARAEDGPKAAPTRQAPLRGAALMAHIRSGPLGTPRAPHPLGTHEVQPQLDEVTRLELECKEAELGLQMHAERCEATRTELAAVKERGLGLEELATLAAKLRLAPAQDPTPTVAEYTY
tara:strand:+ start:323 stop:1330 length:1008 start_codon:yes stop_codon:yes gene_type:complete